MLVFSEAYTHKVEKQMQNQDIVYNAIVIVIVGMTVGVAFLPVLVSSIASLSHSETVLAVAIGN